jgi:pyruvate dehydrogenase E1 component alpha subunit
VSDFSKRGASFGIPGMTVDGMDVEAVMAAGLEAFEFCRAGKGPIILEMKTYRYRGHSMSDPAKYRSKEELTEMREKRDPIENYGKKLIERGVVNEQDLKQMDAEVKRVVVQSAEFATESPEPALSELYTDIYG